VLRSISVEGSVKYGAAKLVKAQIRCEKENILNHRLLKLKPAFKAWLEVNVLQQFV
jgi:hypothetical protein